MCVGDGAHVEVRGQLAGVGSFLLPSPLWILGIYLGLVAETFPPLSPLTSLKLKTFNKPYFMNACQNSEF